MRKARSEKVYSGLDRIPSGRASGRITEACLVLEGGAFRGLYTQGFLDAMMLAGLNCSCVIGVSAGALAGMNYVSGQIGRSARTNLGFRHDSRYVGLRALLHSRSPLDVGFLTEDRGILEPFDGKSFYEREQRLIAVATDCLTGRPAYFEKGKCDILKAVRASATMPFISPMVRIDGTPYLDGGCSCKIGYRRALKEGYRKILVVRTREVAFRKPVKRSKLARMVYRKYPRFVRSLQRSNEAYNRQCEEIEWLHEHGYLLRLAQSEPVRVSRLEPDMEKLGALYWLGFHDFEAQREAIESYLSAPDPARKN